MRAHLKIAVYLLSLFLLQSCSQEVDDPIEQQSNQSRQFLPIIPDQDLHLNPANKNKQIIAPKFGDRLTIKGDFNGNGKEDILQEHFVDATGIETHKSFTNLEYDQLVYRLSYRKTRSYFSCTEGVIDTFYLSQQLNFGLYLLQNEGDLNNDGKDEISYVIDYADWSSLNTYHVLTFNNGTWKEILSFPIWEWQLTELQKEEGLLKITDANKIEYYGRNEESELDTMNHVFPVL